MIIERLKLTNWGPHASLDMDMAAGIAGVIGSNGSGKSNVLQAIDFAFTKNLNGRKKETYIRNYGSPEGAKKAVVELWWSKNGKKGHITRTINPSGIKSKLEWDGSEYTKEAAIATCMEEMMGVDKATLVSSIFTKQGCLSDIVTGTPGERQTLFFKLLNLAYLDPRSADVAKKIEQLRSGVVDYGPALNEILDTIRELKEQKEGIDKSISEIEDPSEDIDFLRNVLSVSSNISDTARLIDNYTGTANTNADEATRIAKSLGFDDPGEVIDTHTTLGMGVSNNTQALRVAEEAVRAYTAYNEDSNQLAAAQNELEAAKNAIPTDMPEAVTLQDQLVQLTTQQGQSKAIADQEATVKRLTAAKEEADKEYQAAIAVKNSPMAQAVENLVTTYRENLKEIDNSLTQAKKVLSFYNEDGTPALGSVCPTCGQNIASKSKEAIDKLKYSLDQYERSRKQQDTLLQINIKKIEEQIDGPLNAATSKFMLADKLLSEAMATARRLVSQSPGGLLPYEEYTDVIKETQLRLQERSRLDARVHAAEVQVRTAKSRLATYKVIPATPEEGLVDRIRETLSNQEQEIARIKDGTQSILALRGAIIRINDAITAEENNLKTLKASLEKLCEQWPASIQHLMAESETVLLAEIDNKQMVKGRLDSLRDQRDSLIAHIELKVEREEELRKLIAQNAEKSELIRELSDARAMILKTGTPAQYMDEVFKKMTPFVNSVLADMGANFSVTPDPDQAITYRFIRLDNPSGAELPQEALSGGQAIRLALAMLLAVQKTLLSEVGLLVLDEPSSHIDAEGVASMAVMFSKLGKVLSNSETQLIVVDHNPALINSFEKVVTLGDAN